MATDPRRPEALNGRVFRGSTAVSCGLLTPDALRSKAWRRLFHDVYVDASVPLTHQMRCTAAAAYVLPKGAVVAGRSAATLWRTGLAGSGDAVEVLAPPERRFGPVAGLRIHIAEFDPGRTKRIGAVPLTDPVRTCWDLAHWLEPAEAVVLVDRMLAIGLVTAVELERYAVERRADRGGRRFARAVALADPAAESPPESRLRVGLVLAGLPRPETQYVIADENGFVARVDLAWRERKVALEYDGVWHAGTPEQIHRDRHRLNRLQCAGWTVLYVTARRLRDDFPGLVAEIRAALGGKR